MTSLKPFLCNSSAAIRVIFVAIFLASSYKGALRFK